MIDDESQAAQVVTLFDGRVVAGAIVPLITDSFDGRPLELDGEGVAFSDGAFYVIGSHGHPRDRKHRLDPQSDADEIASKIKASSQVVRVHLPPSAWTADAGTVDGDLRSSSRLREAIASNVELAPSMDQRLDGGGMTIEGIAVNDGRLYVGFRSPLLHAQSAVIMDVGLGSVFGSGSLDAKFTTLNLGGRGIRDLTVSDGSFLILAGPAEESGDGFAIYMWDKSTTTLLGELPPFGDDAKPEAIVQLDGGSGSRRVLVLSDGLKEGGPRAVTLAR